MARVVNTWAASVGLDGAVFSQWLAGVRRALRRPALEQLVSVQAEPTPSATDLWRQAVIAAREAKARKDTRGQHQAIANAKHYAELQLRGVQ